MADITVKFTHPRSSSILTATIDDSLTAAEALNALIANDFIADEGQGYNLVVRGGDLIGLDQTFASAGVKDEDIIRIIPMMSTGGREYRQEGKSKKEIGIPGLDKRSIKDFTIEDVRNSPEALIMIVHLYDDLQIRYEKLSMELEEERFRARDRFVAALLLLISQAILSIGGNLLTSNKPIAIPVFIAGGLQAALALYLTFRKPKINA